MPSYNGDPGEAIAYALLQAPAVTALIGQNVYPVMPTQDAGAPYIVYRRTGGGGANNLGGRRKLQQYTYRLDVQAETQAIAEAVLVAARTALASFRDISNGVQSILLSDDADAAVDSENAYRTPGQSFSIWFAG